MKYLQFLFLTFMILTFSLSKIAAQDGFPSLLTYNSVILVDYKETSDPKIKAEIIKLFDGLSKKIDGCEWVHIGDLSESTKGFDQAITLTFDSKDSLEKYELHPSYLRFKELIAEVSQGFEKYGYWEKLD